MRVIFLCAPSICCTTALTVWETLQLWHPAGLLGWAGALALWAACLLVIFSVHMGVASALIPDDAPDRQGAIRRRMDRLRAIADINDATMDDPSLRPRESLERRR